MCEHPSWALCSDAAPFTPTVGFIQCTHCGHRAIGKPWHAYDHHLRALAVNEVVCSRLIDLLRPVCAVVAPYARLADLVDSGAIPRCRRIAVIDYLGTHARIGPQAQPAGAVWPGWLYDFSRWVGRLDNTGETNLLLCGAQVVPVDWGMTFPWASLGPRELLRKVDDFAVPHREEERAARDPAVSQAIQQVTDDQLWDACTMGITGELISPALLTAYWSGLCLRRDMLIAEAHIPDGK